MQAIFASGVDTRIFTIGFNEPLGEPAEPEAFNLDADAAQTTLDQAEGSDLRARGEGPELCKRKRGRGLWVL